MAAFMSTNVLKGNDTLKWAIRGSPSNFGRFYDSIYTERYIATLRKCSGLMMKNSPFNYAA